MKHTNCAVCAILEVPQQLKPARVPNKEHNRYETEGGTIILQIPEAFILKSIHSF